MAYTIINKKKMRILSINVGGKTVSDESYNLLNGKDKDKLTNNQKFFREQVSLKNLEVIKVPVKEKKKDK